MIKKKERPNFFSLNLKEYNKVNQIYIDKTIDILKKDRLVIINWLRNGWKVNFIKEFINTTWSNNNYFYFNKSEDIYNNIKDYKDLENLLNDYIKLYKKPNFIFLQNIDKINNIKNFISKIYKEEYNIILVWNNIKIWWINEIEIVNFPIINNDNIFNIIKYWYLNNMEKIEDIEIKEKYLKLLSKDIFLDEIFKNFWVKNIILYNLTLTYLSENNTFLSLRELQRNINNITNISLKTTMDYIDFSIQVKILKKINIFDFKKNKTITSKVKYYFTDNWIRNSLVNFNLKNDILIENLIFNKLKYNNYSIYWGLNGKFNFTFFGKLDNKEIFIHVSDSVKKVDIKKEVKKLLKIWREWNKILLVEDIKKLWIKKVKYDSVEIVEVEDFLVRF
jgi:predicted AAA+ superfamily ATPase